MDKKLRIASWNVGGARKIRSLKQFDYAEEDAAYFAEQLAALSPDIVCLQETHTSDQRSLAAEIAGKLGISYVYNRVVSKSHLDNDYRLGNAILSRHELHHVADATYPYPEFANFFPDGRPSQHHDKMVQIFELDGLTIANTQMLPIHIFGEQYDSGKGAELAAQIDETLCAHLHTPLVLCGDINFNTPADVYPLLYKKFALQEAPPDTVTRPNIEGAKKTPDHILVSRPMRILRSDVIIVEADHYLCFAEISTGPS